MNAKRRIVAARFALLIAVMCSVGIMFLPQQASAQQRRNKTQGWEYAAILSAGRAMPPESKDKSVGIATICYFQISGCRKEEVVFEIIYADFLKVADPRQSESYNRMYAAPLKAAESALSKAIAKLGNDGWEMVGEGRTEFSNDNNVKAIYFKRRR